jgi:hypothetical protein
LDTTLSETDAVGRLHFSVDWRAGFPETGIRRLPDPGIAGFASRTVGRVGKQVVCEALGLDESKRIQNKNPHCLPIDMLTA